jgi:hypothetical protein
MKVYITPEAKQRLDLYVDAVTGEISGLGRATCYKGVIFISEIYLLHQESSAGETELVPSAVADFINELIATQRDPGEVKVWWHSHANMGAFWSTTDDKTAENFSNGWMLSLVVNKKGEYKCRLDVYEPVHLTADNLDLVVCYPPAAEAMKKEIELEVKEKVKSKTYVVCSGGTRWDNKEDKDGCGTNRYGHWGIDEKTKHKRWIPSTAKEQIEWDKQEAEEWQQMNQMGLGGMCS